ncbi:hypothetical protein F4802DRAFT_572068 [Xylaria palmicola]|nr:hypothetical protein F4802DRAFT_572068 [Xylaria palmicola]
MYRSGFHKIVATNVRLGIKRALPKTPAALVSAFHFSSSPTKVSHFFDQPSHNQFRRTGYGRSDRRAEAIKDDSTKSSDDTPSSKRTGPSSRKAQFPTRLESGAPFIDTNEPPHWLPGVSCDPDLTDEITTVHHQDVRGRGPLYKRELDGDLNHYKRVYRELTHVYNEMQRNAEAAWREKENFKARWKKADAGKRQLAAMLYEIIQFQKAHYSARWGFRGEYGQLEIKLQEQRDKVAKLLNEYFTKDDEPPK